MAIDHDKLLATLGQHERIGAEFLYADAGTNPIHRELAGLAILQIESGQVAVCAALTALALWIVARTGESIRNDPVNDLPTIESAAALVCHVLAQNDPILNPEQFIRKAPDLEEAAKRATEIFEQMMARVKQ